MSGAMYDVCIVGAGLTGSAAARWTSLQQDTRVCLIGPNEPTEHEWTDPSRTIFGAHYDQGRVVSEVCMNNAHDSWIEFTQRSIARFKDLEIESGIKFYTEGRNILISHEADVKEKWRKRRNKNTAQCFHGDELHNVLPAFKPLPGGMGAILETSEGGYINPRAYIMANKAIASRNGCDLVEEVVQEIREGSEYNDDDDDDVDGGNEGNKHIRRNLKVRTQNGRVIRAKRVLLCPGAFVNFESLLPNGKEVDITTTAETYLKVEVDDDDLECLQSFPCGCVDLEDEKDPRNCYFLSPIEYPDGKYYMKFGHGPDMNRPLFSPAEITDWYQRRSNIPTAVQENLTERFFRWAKEFKPKSVTASTCVITNTPTRRYYCDMATANIGVVVGGNGSGACVADEVGKMGAQMIVKGSWDHDLPTELFKLRYR